VEAERSPLWAPWRMEYVRSGDAAEGCIFCEPTRPRADRERLILHRGGHCFVLLNRYPYAGGHLMVVPYQHTPGLSELTSETQTELMRRLGQATDILRDTYHCHGFNLGLNIGDAAGAGFAEHLHVHVVPRWRGDTNFMTCVAELRVIPSHIQRIYEELAPRFAELSDS
jgi:ATP adenylyltransferase